MKAKIIDWFAVNCGNIGSRYYVEIEENDRTLKATIIYIPLSERFHFEEFGPDGFVPYGYPYSAEQVIRAARGLPDENPTNHTTPAANL